MYTLYFHALVCRDPENLMVLLTDKELELTLRYMSRSLKINDNRIHIYYYIIIIVHTCRHCIMLVRQGGALMSQCKYMSVTSSVGLIYHKLLPQLLPLGLIGFLLQRVSHT